MKTDLEIARQSLVDPIETIAAKLGLKSTDIDLYGKYKAKLNLNLIREDRLKQNKLILVSSMSPTPAGEGKTTTSIGLADALNAIGKKTIVVLREPSLGPVFGLKGGATGGGFAQVVPMEDINLHFTGDFAAIEKAHNLLAAMVDNQIYSNKSELRLNPSTIRLKRVMDMNDRALRQIILGLTGSSDSRPRESGFDITAASEVMAILCLARNIRDLKSRLGQILIGLTWDNQPVYARDIKAEGAMATLLKDAIRPNLVQTLENNPAIIHGGPFANIAQGTNSVIATSMGLSLSPYVVTEAGFGSDLGAEKFLDIKCQSAGLSPQCVVLVASCRAIKYHGGASLNTIDQSNPEALKRGLPNLAKHIDNIKAFNLIAIVSINRFANDCLEELELIVQFAKDHGVNACINDSWAKGSSGAIDLAKAVAKIADQSNHSFSPIYNDDDPITTKIEKIVKTIYGGKGVEYSAKAKRDLALIENLGLGKSSVCIAKTEKSLSDNPSLIGRPDHFVVIIREVEIAAGAGFVIPITGTIMRMPGLPAKPSAETIDIDDEGVITGLF